jgi:hypothetical protein
MRLTEKDIDELKITFSNAIGEVYEEFGTLYDPDFLKIRQEKLKELILDRVMSELESYLKNK